jgi:hypothetical protein
MCSAGCIFASAKRIEELQFLHLANCPFFLLSGIRMLEAGLRAVPEEAMMRRSGPAR